MALTAEDEKWLDELVKPRSTDASDASAPRFGSKHSLSGSRDLDSRRSSLRSQKSLDSVTSLLEKLTNERSAPSRSSPSEAAADVFSSQLAAERQISQAQQEASSLREQLQRAEASLQSLRSELEETSQREQALARAAKQEASQEVTLVREELQRAQASLQSLRSELEETSQREQALARAAKPEASQEVVLLKEELQRAQASLQSLRSELEETSQREQALAPAAKPEASQEVVLLKEELQRAQASLQSLRSELEEASQREQALAPAAKPEASQEVILLKEELQRAQASLQTLRSELEETSQREQASSEVMLLRAALQRSESESLHHLEAFQQVAAELRKTHQELQRLNSRGRMPPKTSPANKLRLREQVNEEGEHLRNLPESRPEAAEKERRTNEETRAALEDLRQNLRETEERNEFLELEMRRLQAESNEVQSEMRSLEDAQEEAREKEEQSEFLEMEMRRQQLEWQEQVREKEEHKDFLEKEMSRQQLEWQAQHKEFQSEIRRLKDVQDQEQHEASLVMELEKQRKHWQNRSREAVQEVLQLQNEMESFKNTEVLAAAELERSSAARRQQLEAHQEIRVRSQVTKLEQNQLLEIQMVKQELEEKLDEEKRKSVKEREKQAELQEEGQLRENRLENLVAELQRRSEERQEITDLRFDCLPHVVQQVQASQTLEDVQETTELKQKVSQITAELEAAKAQLRQQQAELEESKEDVAGREEETHESDDFVIRACLSRLRNQLAARGVTSAAAMVSLFARFDTQRDQASITQVGFVCALQQGGFLLSKSEADFVFTHFARRETTQVWRLYYEDLHADLALLPSVLPEVEFVKDLLRSADEACRAKGKSLQMLFDQLELESVSVLDVRAILSRYFALSASSWAKLLHFLDKNHDGTVPWRLMLKSAGLGRPSVQSPKHFALTGDSDIAKVSAKTEHSSERAATEKAEVSVISIDLTRHELRLVQQQLASAEDELRLERETAAAREKVFQAEVKEALGQAGKSSQISREMQTELEEGETIQRPRGHEPPEPSAGCGCAAGHEADELEALKSTIQELRSSQSSLEVSLKQECEVQVSLQLRLEGAEEQRARLEGELKSQKQLHDKAGQSLRRHQDELREPLKRQEAAEELAEHCQQRSHKLQEELENLQRQMEVLQDSEAHQEIRLHSKLTQFEQAELRAMQEVRHELQERLQDQETKHLQHVAQALELQKLQQGREEALESTCSDLEKQRSFWKQRSDEEVREFLRLESDMKNLRDSEELVAAEQQKALHMTLRQQRMEAHEELRLARDERQKAVEALQNEEEKWEEKHKASARELKALRASFQQEFLQAEHTLQLRLCQERGRVDAACAAEVSEALQQMEEAKKESWTLEAVISHTRTEHAELQEELTARNQLCDEAAKVLKHLPEELEMEMQLEEERQEKERRLESKVMELEQEKEMEQQKSRKDLESKDKEIKDLRKHLRRAAEQHDTSPVNKRKFRGQLAALQTEYEEKLQQVTKQPEAAKSEVLEAKVREEVRQVEERSEQLAEVQSEVQMAKTRLQRKDEEMQELVEALAASRSAAADAAEAREAELEVQESEVTAWRQSSEESEQRLLALRSEMQSVEVEVIVDEEPDPQTASSRTSPREELVTRLQEAEMAAARAEEQLADGVSTLRAQLHEEEMRASQSSELQHHELVECRSEIKRLKEIKVQATFTTLEHSEADEEISILKQQLQRAQERLALQVVPASTADLESELEAARSSIKEELQCYNVSRLEQEAKFQKLLAEKDIERERLCEDLSASTGQLASAEANIQQQQQLFLQITKAQKVQVQRLMDAEREKEAMLKDLAREVEARQERSKELESQLQSREAEDLFQKQSYAEVLLQSGQYEKAEEVQRSIAEIFSKNFGEEDRLTIMSRLELVNIQQILGKTEEAEEIHRVVRQSLQQDDSMWQVSHRVSRCRWQAPPAPRVSRGPTVRSSISEESADLELDHVPEGHLGVAKQRMDREQQQRHVMLSGRFNDEKIVAYIKSFQNHLEMRGIKTFKVDCGLGEDFSGDTMMGMYNAWAMVIFGTSEYGAKTGAGYETYFELNLAHQMGLTLFPLQLCDHWPPEPTDKDGRRLGAAQNNFVLRRSMIRATDLKMEKPEEMAEQIAEAIAKMEEAQQNLPPADILEPQDPVTHAPKTGSGEVQQQNQEEEIHRLEAALQESKRQREEFSGELAALQSEVQQLRDAQVLRSERERLVLQSEQQLEAQGEAHRRALEEWRNQRCSLRGQLRQSLEDQSKLQDKLAVKEKDCAEACRNLGTLWAHYLEVQEECQVQDRMLKGGLRRTLEEQQQKALELHRIVKVKERELMEISLSRQEWGQEEEQLKAQLEKSEIHCRRQEEEAEEWQKAERKRCAREKAKQEASCQAEVERITADYEKALLKCANDQARLLSRYEREKEEWASDWKELNGLIEPLIHGNQAASAQLFSRQVAAREGMEWFQRFAQLKELQIQELRHSQGIAPREVSSNDELQEVQEDQKRKDKLQKRKHLQQEPRLGVDREMELLRRHMHAEAISLTSLKAEVQSGILVIYSKLEAKPMIAVVDSDFEEKPPEIPKHFVPRKFLKLQPEGTSFHETIRLIVPLDAEANVALLSSTEGWHEVPASFGNNFVEVKIQHFSWLCMCFRAGYSQLPTSPAEAGRSPAVAAPPPQASIDGGHRRHMLLSGRFNTRERVEYLQRVKQGLEALQVPVEMVDVGPGESFAMPTMAALYYAKILVAFCTEDYGEETGARYETFWELRYAWEQAILILPVRLCLDFPPKPPGEPGKIQNSFIFSRTTIYIDGLVNGLQISAEEVARRLHDSWQRQG